jgi:hypothetical protein
MPTFVGRRNVSFARTTKKIVKEMTSRWAVARARYTFNISNEAYYGRQDHKVTLIAGDRKWIGTIPFSEIEALTYPYVEIRTDNVGTPKGRFAKFFTEEM